MTFSISMNKKVSRTYPSNIFTRDWSHFRSDEYNDSLIEFTHIYDRNVDIHKKFSNLQEHIDKCTEAHAPTRVRTIKEQKFSSKPWISESIQNSINNKNNLYKYLQTHDNREPKKEYNKMKKIKFAAEQNFYGRLFDKYQNDSKKIWNLINEITCRKKT